MRYTDRIYGETEIEEPVALELINSPSMQRLKGVDQIGYFEPYFPGTTHTRFEHSLGVYLLLKRYGAPREEQIAGLIHDASHSAFSHCIDYVLDAGSQKEHNHQDNVFDAFVKRSEIPAILEKHEFDTDYILNDEHFPLKEKELPDLCADRIDYSFRTATIFKEISADDARRLLDDLTVKDGNWIFKNFTSAKQYAELFRALNTKYYAGIFSALMFKTVGDYLRAALKKGYILETDLYTTDDAVLSKIKQYLSTDRELQLLSDRMNNKISYHNAADDRAAHIFCKSRIVDPLCMDNGSIRRVSDIDPLWKEVVETERKPKEYFLHFER